MKNLLNRSGLLCSLIIVSASVSAQDINFSQFYDLPLLRNPGLAGLFKGDIRVTAAFRSQWQSVTVPYRTIGIGVEYKKSIGLSSDYITYGLQLTNDIAGDSRLTRTQVFPVINYHKSLNSEKDTYLSAGIMGGPVMERFDPSKLTFDDQYLNNSYSTTNPTKQTFSKTGFTYWDAAVGLCFSSVAGENSRYYIGAGLYHFTKPKVAFQKDNDIILNQKYVVNAGLSTPLNDLSQVIVYADYFMQDGARQAQGGLLICRNLGENESNETVNISAGLFYRWKDAFMPVVKLDHHKMSIGITYDINTSKLKSASQLRGGYEVTLSYKAFRNNYNSSADKVRCPRFY
ncbi:MAG: PorP/SprF family type IX secretion system membrane protein [Ferruginibacter sp.]